MSESTLSLSYDDLMKAVAVFLGYGSDSDQWTTQVTSELDGYVQSGIRQFYYPPSIDSGTDHSWSFLNPSTTLDTVASQEVYDLPDDFGRMLSSIYYGEGIYLQPIQIVPESKILSLKSSDQVDTYPCYAAVRYKTSDGSTGQRMEVVFWPVPDAVYELSYRYEAYSGKLSSDFPYPLGGMRHSELVLESCLAIAEQRANDEKGLHWELFSRLLVAGIAADKKQGARHYGHMSGSCESVTVARRSGSVTYKGVTW